MPITQPPTQDAQPVRRRAPDLSAPSRLLAGLERAMRLTDTFVPFNVVVVLRIDGELRPAALRDALDELQRRHPLLRAAVRMAGSRPSFHFDVAGLIPLSVEDRPAQGAWIAVAEQELAQRFDLEAGPLVRCRYLRGDRCGDIVLTFQHVIVDATSATRLVGELLTTCSGKTAGEHGTLADEGRLAASALFPPEFSGVRFARAVASFMARQAADELWFRRHSRGVRKPPIFDRGACRIVPIRFPADLTSALVQASRRRRMTLNSILGAGLIAAVQRRLYRSTRAPLRHLVFADLRPRLTRSIPDDMLGAFLTMIRFSVMVERDGDVWALAREIQDSTLRAERAGERQLAYRLSPGVIKAVLGQRSFRWCATAFSYGGAPDIPVAYGPFELTAVHAFPSNWTTGPEYSALARLFRGEIYWDILYLDCDMDGGTAHEVARDLEQILREAAC